jgi:CRISPR-associated protein Cmr1
VFRADRKRSGHQRLAHIPADAFPRAELGLPIVFHFQGRGELKDDPILYPRVDGQRRDRMASPLILKPLALADGRAVPLILRLRTPPLKEVELTKSHGAAAKDTPPSVWGVPAIRDKRLVDPTYQDSPLRGLTEDGSALEAFLARAVQNGYKEIQR